MRLYNTLGREFAELQPRDEGKIGMYVCGATVQSAPHLGHGRSAVVFDVIRRYLEWLGFDVTYVRNVTDVDDKIIAAALEEEVPTDTIVERAYAAFDEAHRRLGVKEPTVEPWATHHIDEMLELIGQLLESGHAYTVDGDVYFSVRSYPEYGKLSRHDPDDLRSGARVDLDDRKKDPLDFALWKAAKPGEPSWNAPWGAGRPGWHIECSAMARKYLGVGFDIHAGGHDLIFPHHENEIAQSEAAAGERFATYWLHNGMMNLEGEKMSKSTGHVVDLLEALDTHRPTAVRLVYLRTHYRKPLDFSLDGLADAESALDRLWGFRRRISGSTEDTPDAEIIERFRAAMDEDFDVAGGLGVLFDLVREGNRRLDDGEDAGALIAAYDEIVAVLGLGEEASDLDDLGPKIAEIAERYSARLGTIEDLLETRDRARSERDWPTSDGIRDDLGSIGIVVEDAPDGSRWHRG
ncbi:MAG: cysteine--tRNA ligase [Actinomycetota bacterium]|nr:cysteine--tRNA ligase [Actinomycetota bacterium]